MRGNDNTNKRRNSQHRNGHKDHPFLCRICRKPHSLKRCYRFLEMNVCKRQEVVRTYGYCKNCLAHTHSQGSCFTKTGCRNCHKHHHTLLHTHARLDKPVQSTAHTTTSDSKKQEKVSKTQPISTSTSENTSLCAILKQNSVTLLPTVLVSIDTKKGKSVVRCLLDSGSRTSCISSKTIEKMSMTTLALEDETICPLTLSSIHDSDIQIEVILKMNNRIAINTPNKSLPSSFKKKFHNIILADTKFYKTAPVDIILGVDIYSRVIREGVLNRDGLPTAQNTIFGWAFYGLCPI